MAWLVIANDSDTGPDIRADAAVMEAHWQYELANRDRVLIAGSLREDDKMTKNGSILLLDVDTRQEAEAFLANDPATMAGLRGQTEIRWLNVAILDKIEQP